MEAPDQKILCFPALPIPDFSRWREESSRNPSPHWAKVTTDTGDARSITLWLRACPPYRPTREGVALSSFYIASNALHAQTRERALNLPLKPLLCCDVWEHAYYLDYQNRRGDYFDAWWLLADWPRISRAYEIWMSRRIPDPGQ